MPFDRVLITDRSIQSRSDGTEIYSFSKVSNYFET